MAAGSLFYDKNMANVTSRDVGLFLSGVSHGKSNYS